MKKTEQLISLESLIELSREEKQDDKDGAITKTPGRYIEIYEVHGNLPKKFAKSGDTSGKYETHLFICAFIRRRTAMKNKALFYMSLPRKKSF